MEAPEFWGPGAAAPPALAQGRPCGITSPPLPPKNHLKRENSFDHPESTAPLHNSLLLLHLLRLAMASCAALLSSMAKVFSQSNGRSCLEGSRKVHVQAWQPRKWDDEPFRAVFALLTLSTNTYGHCVQKAHQAKGGARSHGQRKKVVEERVVIRCGLLKILKRVLPRSGASRLKTGGRLGVPEGRMEGMWRHHEACVEAKQRRGDCVFSGRTLLRILRTPHLTTTAFSSTGCCRRPFAPPLSSPVRTWLWCWSLIATAAAASYAIADAAALVF
ncbi:hypothetical protein HU200_028834 [Digitaria exilis]|uniref:Uncharacterized protein n=1 Tax=Digitaria exilis TaxID=1010633 RepID=A0A835C678_9POAL|nr:hypothetical protein HU200_028834 [Digitaria exilis]